jgi:hypothetical protein
MAKKNKSSLTAPFRLLAPLDLPPSTSLAAHLSLGSGSDNQLALLVGDFITEVFDRYGFTSEFGFSGVFEAAILNGWDSSSDRANLTL